MLPVALLSPGETGEITEIRVHAHAHTCTCGQNGTECGDSCSCGVASHMDRGGVRLEEMGLRIGKRIEMLANGNGPVLLRVDESRIAIARGMAMNILVRRLG